MRTSSSFGFMIAQSEVRSKIRGWLFPPMIQAKILDRNKYPGTLGEFEIQTKILQFISLPKGLQGIF